MTWLFIQLWILILIAFLLGGLVAWLGAKMLLPHVDDLEAETGLTSEGVL